MPKQKMAMLCDVPGWCFDRTGNGMVNYHNTMHSWEIEYARPHSGERPPDLQRLNSYDVLRVGGVPLMRWFFANGFLGPGKRVVPTVASFRDLDAARIKWLQRPDIAEKLLGIIINDQRQAPQAVQLGVPVIYSPDRVCHEMFAPMPELRPKNGPIRVGWAGSEQYWQGVKNVGLIASACTNLKMEFVRQDREEDGLKSPEQMAKWLNGLDVYVAANIERSCTPVTTLEAVACGVLVMTTRCGEMWPLIKSFMPQLIINKGNLRGVREALSVAKEIGRDELQLRGMEFRHCFAEDFVTWQCGEAQRVTRTLAALRKREMAKEALAEKDVQCE